MKISWYINSGGPDSNPDMIRQQDQVSVTFTQPRTVMTNNLHKSKPYSIRGGGCYYCNDGIWIFVLKIVIKGQISLFLEQ